MLRNKLLYVLACYQLNDGAAGLREEHIRPGGGDPVQHDKPAVIEVKMPMEDPGGEGVLGCEVVIGDPPAGRARGEHQGGVRQVWRGTTGRKSKET